MNTTPDKSTFQVEKSDDSREVAYVLGLLAAFVAGMSLVMILALAARNAGLRRQLDQRPAVVIVERTVAHE